MTENIKDYSVNYEIKVKANDAINKLSTFKEQVDKLDGVKAKLQAFVKDLADVQAQFNKISINIPKIDFDTQKAHRKLDKIITKLEKIQRLGAQANVITVNEVDKNTSSQTRTRTTRTTSRTTSKPPKGRIPENAAYRVLGPSMIDSNMSALDFAKGMGIAYGVAGMGTLMGSALSESAAYDNIMKTTRNILATHDLQPDFDRRFREMERTVRDVGVETKYTSPQVADAAKFLAMAGFDLNAINNSIRPIADIALVGDTELGETADVVTNIMTGYGITPDKVRNAADIMTMTFTMANTTLTEIAEAYKYSASLLAAGGVSFEEATAAMGILGDAGIKGSQAGTTLRTIMANIANPTAKQRKQWEKLGIERLDKYGNIRDLTDIFGDLKAKNLSVSEYYNLFHKTAAQGAVSLTLGVDKWNDIVRNNFLSEGVVSKLAEEKKQTVEGLWAQLTSAFTETGLKVFEEMNDPIRGFLKETTAWLESNEAFEMMRGLAKTTMEMLQILKEFALWAVKFYNNFKGVIDLWIKFQLYAMPFLGIFRALRAGGNVINYVIKSVGGLSVAFRNLFGLFRNRSNQSIWQTIIGGQGTQRRGISGWILDNYGSAFGYGNTAGLSDVQARYQRIYGDRIVRARIGGALKGIAGAGLLGGAGYMFADTFLSLTSLEDSTKNLITTIFTVATSALGGLGSLTSLMSVALPAAILAGLAALSRYVVKVKDCIAAHWDFINSTRSLNGIIQDTSRQTEADKFLSIVYDRQMDANRAIGEHINLMREQLGLMKQGSKELENQKTFNETHGNVAQNLEKSYGSWFGRLLMGDAFSTIDEYANKIGLRTVKHKNGVMEYFAGNFSLGSDESKATEIGAVANTLYAMGQDLGKGSQAKTILDGYLYRFLQNPNLKDYELLRGEITSLYGNNTFNYLSGSERWTIADLKKSTKEQYESSYYYQKGLRDIITGSLTPGTVFGDFLSTWKTLLTEIEQNKVNNSTIEKLMLVNGIDIFNKERYGAFGSNEFMSKFGWKDGKWNGGIYPFLNPNTGEIDNVAVTADEARKNFLLFHQRINEFVRKLSPQMQSYFDSYLNSPIWNLGNTTAGTTPEGTTQTINGKLYKWETKAPNAYGMWYPVDGNGEPLKQSEAVTLMDKVHNKIDDNNSGKVDQSGYKSMYQSNSAAPKQVIVNIGSLMDVKSIDLSNPDNSVVIENLKSELAQALIDVVHDFDETYHG